MAVEPHGGFVQRQTSRFPGQHRGEGQEPLLGRRKFMRMGLQLVPEARRRPAPPAPGRRLRPEPPVQAEVTSRRTVRSNSWSRGCWKSRPTRSATLPAGIRRCLRRGSRTSPVGRTQQAVEMPQQRGFPGPVRARHSHDLSRPYGQAQVGQDPALSGAVRRESRKRSASSSRTGSGSGPFPVIMPQSDDAGLAVRGSAARRTGLNPPPVPAPASRRRIAAARRCPPAAGRAAGGDRPAVEHEPLGCPEGQLIARLAE